MISYHNFLSDPKLWNHPKGSLEVFLDFEVKRTPLDFWTKKTFVKNKSKNGASAHQISGTFTGDLCFGLIDRYCWCGLI